ncbi:sensor histidine kinase [Chondrinema litorale]|uniref:sensor histidine kinase n=1 Tax=Chondrinema litorale TaxID=2994555 RepID=UPI0025429AC4|nr:HAMP domain-containing sensor histidine kinase [Chondrinema litorale]UZR99667.1 HAMP domain-containing sensor histidine kinase [Chondrinema litorale]
MKFFKFACLLMLLSFFSCDDDEEPIATPTCSDGIPNGDETGVNNTIEIIINPPWWKANLAYSFYLLIFLGSMTVIYFFIKGKWELKRRLELVNQESIRLKELDKVKTNLFTSITHELRTPLTLILGQLELLKIGLFDSKQINRVQIAEFNAKKLLYLVNQLLDFAKAESNFIKPKMSEQDVVSYLKDIFNSIIPLYTQKQIEYYFHSEVESLKMYFDSEKLEKVFINLLSNAWKFTPNKGKIELHIKKESSNWVVIELSDSGKGISEENLSKIFDRFYQVPDDGNISQDISGTGIGLALVKQLLEFHHGKIEISSVVNLGTNVTVWLPLGKKHLHEEQIIKTPNVSKNARSEGLTLLDLYSHSLRS